MTAERTARPRTAPRVGSKRTGRAASALAARLGGDARSGILTLLILTLPLLAVSPANPRWHGLPAAFFEAGGAALTLSLLGQRPRRTWAWARRGPTPWLLAFAGWEAVSACLAPDKRFALLGLLGTGAGLAVYAAAPAVAESRRLRLLLDSLTVAVLLCSGLTIVGAQTLGSLHAISDNDAHLVVSGQTHLPRLHTQVATAPISAPTLEAGPFRDKRLLTAFLLATLPLLLATAGSPSHARRRLAAGLAAAVGLGALAVIGALGAAWPGLVTGATVLGLIALRYVPRWRDAGRNARRAKRAAQARIAAHLRGTGPRSARLPPGLRGWAVAKMRQASARLPLAWLGTACAVAACLAWLGTREPRPQAAPPHPPAAAQESSDGRAARQAALALARQRPVFGWGLASYPLRQKAWTGLGRPPALVRRHGAGLTEQAHSLYLQMAAEAGLPALLLWLAALVAFFATGLRALARLPNASLRQRALAGTLAGVAAQTVDAVTNPAWQYGQVQFTLWLLLGLGTACAFPEPSAPASRPDARPARTLLLVLLGALLAALIAWTLPLLPAARG